MTALSYLANPTTTRTTLERFGLATKKSLGQNFLVNDAIIQKICDLAELSKDDFVLEVGPGIGTLTVALLQKAGWVFSVERDTDLPKVLAYTCEEWNDHFSLVNKDALDLNLDDLKNAAKNLEKTSAIDSQMLPNKFVANLPYAVAATLILAYFQSFDSLQEATVMVQAEVADRIAAVPGTKNYGAYTVKLSLYTQVAGRFKVSPNNFFAPPRVDSAVVHLVRRNSEKLLSLTPQQRLSICEITDAAFASRRKTISNSCKTYFAGRGNQGKQLASLVLDILHEAGIDERRRGETLTLDEFVDLGLVYHKIKCSLNAE